jgi:hypothetical protein
LNTQPVVIIVSVPLDTKVTDAYAIPTIRDTSPVSVEVLS